MSCTNPVIAQITVWFAGLTLALVTAWWATRD
jgi:hypothetical protein